MTRYLPIPLLLAVAIAAAGAATATDLTSAWRTADLAIDGSDAEWPGAATLIGETPVAVGIANDGEHLFVRIRTSDRTAAMQILFGGLTVWVDPGGREKKVFGLKYPVGTTLPEPARPQGPPPDPATLVPPRVELLGPGKDAARSLVLEHLPAGIEVGIARLENSLVYELKVPLTKTADRPYAIGATPGARIAIGLETGRVQRPEVRNRPGGMMGGGRPGGGGPGGMGPGGMGRSGGRGGADRADWEGLSKTLKAWARVQLATVR